jgi:hypothetical protein
MLTELRVERRGEDCTVIFRAEVRVSLYGNGQYDADMVLPCGRVFDVLADDCLAEIVDYARKAANKSREEAQ